MNLRHVSSAAVRVISLAVLTLIAGCGKYGRPFSPEEVSPKEVKDVTVTASDSSVTFNWSAPSENQRNKELKQIDGYRIVRKEIIKRGDETSNSIPFDEVAFVKDEHISIRDALREDARASGKVGRRIQAPVEETTFIFTDPTVKSGVTYLYRIEPISMGDVKGKIGQLWKFTFEGAKTDIAVIQAKELSLSNTQEED